MNLKIAPSILSADFAYLAQDCRDVLNAGADWLHVDVMEGDFVPNLSLGIPVLAGLSKAVDAFYDVHLMIAVRWSTSRRLHAPGLISLPFI